ncbi:response regulator [Roseibium litorale]|uniref:response regulator n=1 Tax=Roseibium litorale TaxID=2803841 RepID=UPI001AD8C207
MLTKILYADDEPDIREIVCLTLRELGGYDVMACENGKQAALAACEYKPNLLLLDVMMPEMSGPEALMAIRAREEASSIPAIFITAKAKAEEITELNQFSRSAVIPKPFDPISLPSQIAQLFETLESEE